MSFRIQIGPPQIAIHDGQTAMVSDLDGQVRPPSEKGFYFNDTRLMSAWFIRANGEPWALLNGGAINYFAGRVFMVNRAFRAKSGPEHIPALCGQLPDKHARQDKELERDATVTADSNKPHPALVPAHSIELVLSRSMGGGMHEDIDIVNYGADAVTFNLEIMIASDFADIFEVKAHGVLRRGTAGTGWSDEDQALCNTYCNGDFRRALHVKAVNSGSSATYADGWINFEVALAAGGTWHTCFLYEPIDGDTRLAAPKHCIEDVGNSDGARALDDWRAAVPQIETSNEEWYRMMRRAIDDMAALRLPQAIPVAAQDGTDATNLNQESFMPAAGLPWFLAPFGRDSLIASLQTILLNPDFARGTLKVLADLQACKADAWRDAEPGKIMHELRRGEQARLALSPHDPYYGTADATPLFLVTLHAAWRRTGDLTLLEQHLATAERCLEWIDRHGDRDGDGFQEYQTRSSAGAENQGWKDSGDAVRHADGSAVDGPRALCELQGYVYDAWVRMAEAFEALGQPKRAATLRAKADVLFHNFNEMFWNEEGGFYALALDGAKRQVRTVASNPGHLLWSGIVPPERASRVASRLMADDMWSGWGIRTLSTRHPSYNPHSYQNGSVWPHDNGIIAVGLRRYGFATEAARVARGISDAAGHFLLHQLPELFAGVQRNSTNFPVQYIGANVPQAWAAGSAFMFQQAILGLNADGPGGRLCVDPVLPDWLPDIRVSNLRVAAARWDIRFWREGNATRFEVLDGDRNAVAHVPFARSSDIRRRGDA